MVASLTEREREFEIICDTIDILESEQALDPKPGIEVALNNLRYVRNTRARSDGAHVAALEAFVRDTFARSWPAELDDISPGEPDGIRPEDLLPV